jgi:peptidoglycan hydrolase-like protein with peptidoglycan-binding domain
MRYSVRRVLFCAGAAAAVGVSACAQIGTASAAEFTTAAHQVKAAPAAHQVKSAAAAAYVPPRHNFSFGARGPAVRSVQRRLNQGGPGPAVERGYVQPGHGQIPA